MMVIHTASRYISKLEFLSYLYMYIVPTIVGRGDGDKRLSISAAN